MLNKILGTTLLLFVANSSLAHAHPDQPAAAFGSFYTTAAEGDLVQKTNFSWDSKPWLYAALPSSQSASNVTYNVEAWFQASATTTPYIKFSNTTNSTAWFSAIPDNDWAVLKQPGTWHITTTALTFNTDSPFGVQQYAGETSFKINAAPEPVSAALFLTGALVMGAGVLRRRQLA